MRDHIEKCGKKKRGHALTALCMAALSVGLLAGCGEPQPVTGSKNEDEFENLISVGFSQIGSESLWRDANSDSIQNALTKENGFFLLFNNARQKQENQIKAIRSFISQRVDYIAFSPVTQDGWETVLTEAQDAGIPVIVVDRKVAPEFDDLYTAWVGTDSHEEGRQAGLWLEQHLEETHREDEELNIAVLLGTIGSSAQVGRSKGFQEIAETHPNWNIVAEENGDFTTAKGKEVMEEILKTQPDLDVVVSQNDDMTFGALEAMEEAGLSVSENGMIVISFDAARKGLELVQQGIINVDVECNALQGPSIEELIRRLEAGEAVDKENVVEEAVFTRENVDAAIEDRLY